MKWRVVSIQTSPSFPIHRPSLWWTLCKCCRVRPRPRSSQESCCHPSTPSISSRLWLTTSASTSPNSVLSRKSVATVLTPSPWGCRKRKPDSVSSWQLAVGSWQLACGSQLSTANCQLSTKVGVFLKAKEVGDEFAWESLDEAVVLLNGFVESLAFHQDSVLASRILCQKSVVGLYGF